MKDLTLSYLNAEYRSDDSIALESRKTAERLEDKQWLDKAMK